MKILYDLYRSVREHVSVEVDVPNMEEGFRRIQEAYDNDTLESVGTCSGWNHVGICDDPDIVIFCDGQEVGGE